MKILLVQTLGEISFDFRFLFLPNSIVSPCGCLTLEKVIKDLKDLDWHECHITSLRTQNAANSAASNGAVSVKPKKGRVAASGTTTDSASVAGFAVKPKKARVAASGTTTGTTSVAGTNGVVSVKPKKGRVAASGTTTGTAAAAAVSVKPKKARDSASGTAVAAGSTNTGA